MEHLSISLVVGLDPSFTPFKNAYMAGITQWGYGNGVGSMDNDVYKLMVP